MNIMIIAVLNDDNELREVNAYTNNKRLGTAHPKFEETISYTELSNEEFQKRTFNLVKELEKIKKSRAKKKTVVLFDILGGC